MKHSPNTGRQRIDFRLNSSDIVNYECLINNFQSGVHNFGVFLFRKRASWSLETTEKIFMLGFVKLSILKRQYETM